jgi:hypothetical protein
LQRLRDERTNASEPERTPSAAIAAIAAIVIDGTLSLIVCYASGARHRRGTASAPVHTRDVTAAERALLEARGIRIVVGEGGRWSSSRRADGYRADRRSGDRATAVFIHPRQPSTCRWSVEWLRGR